MEVRNVATKPMSKQRLEQYRALVREINMLDNKLGSVALVSDTVKASSMEPPYIERTLTITGIDEGAIHRLNRKREQAFKERLAIEQFIDSIEDSLTRTIFEERYIQGRSWSQVAKAAGGANTRDSVRMIAKRFLFFMA